MASDGKQCPLCGEQILAVAVKCKHCKAMIGPAPSTAAGSAPRRGLDGVPWPVRIVVGCALIALAPILFIAAMKYLCKLADDDRARWRRDDLVIEQDFEGPAAYPTYRGSQGGPSSGSSGQPARWWKTADEIQRGREDEAMREDYRARQQEERLNKWGLQSSRQTAEYWRERGRAPGWR